MKTFWKAFLFRGLICAPGGPLVLAIVYGILGATGVADTLSPYEVCTGILSITLLAFTAAGMTAIYQVEKLPLPTMILLHGGALYLAYMITYLLNGWLKFDPKVIFIFTIIFIAGYVVIWTMIYFMSIRPAIKKMNRKLQEEV